MYLFILEYLFESRPFDVFDYAFRIIAQFKCTESKIQMYKN